MRPPTSPFYRLLLVLSLVMLLGSVASAAARAEPPAATSSLATPANIKQETFWSESLGRQMAYAIYLPPGYVSDPGRRYPVLYMLHGLGGDHNEWMKNGLFSTASNLIRTGQIPPMIVISPEGERGYWMDHSDNGPRFGAYVSHDLVGYIDTAYRTIPSRTSRAIGGMSMGAHGALQLALNHTDKFSIVGANSLALRRKDQAFAFFGDTKYYQDHDPVSLTRAHADKAKRLKIWMDIGTQDSWYASAEAFHQQLIAQGVPHAWHVYAGGHNDSYWHGHVGAYLRFYGQAFQAPDLQSFSGN